MNLRDKTSALKGDTICNDFLLRLEDQPTPETIRKLQLRIDELEDRLIDQAKLNQCKELELRRIYDEKKGQWILKYLEVKAELKNFKSIHEDKCRLWHQDTSSLVQVITFLLQIIREKEIETFDLLSELRKELGLIVLATLQPSQESRQFHEEHFSGRSHDKILAELDIRLDGMSSTAKKAKGDFCNPKTIEKHMEKLLKTPKVVKDTCSMNENEDESLGSNFSSPNLFPNARGIKRDISFQTPHEKQLTATLRTNSTERPSASTTAPYAVSDVYCMLNSLQIKMETQMKKLRENRVSQHIEFSIRTTEALKRAMKITSDFDKIDEFDLLSRYLSKESELHRENSQSTTPLPKQSKDLYLSHQFSEIRDVNMRNNKLPAKSFCFNENSALAKNHLRDELAFNESVLMGKKVLDKSLKAKDHNIENSIYRDDIFKKLESLQNSLALSDREAILCMLMDYPDDLKISNHVNLDDLLFSSQRKDKNFSIMSNMFPPSLTKLPDQSVLSLQNDDISIKPTPNCIINESVDQSWQNVVVEGFSPTFNSDKKQVQEKKVVFTPHMENRDLIQCLSHLVSPYPGVEIDMNVQNMDMGSFICHNEDGKSQEYDTAGLRGFSEMLKKTEISPIPSRANRIKQEVQQKYRYPTSVEKEYGRKIGGVLNFNDGHMDEFEGKGSEERNNNLDVLSLLPIIESGKNEEEINTLDFNPFDLKSYMDVKKDEQIGKQDEGAKASREIGSGDKMLEGIFSFKA